LLNMDTLLVSRYDTSILNTELSLTNAYLQFYKNNRDKILFSNISPEKAIPEKKVNELLLADTLLLQHIDSSSNNSVAAQYALLKQKLQMYISMARQGEGQPLNLKLRQIKKGSSSPDVPKIKKRLQQMGYPAVADSGKIFNDSLETVIKNYQQRNGMKPSGSITDTLLRSLNVPVAQRIQQLIINLTRMQWMPASQEVNYISVNIPDFILTVYENNTKAFDMPVVVGKEGANTTMFSGSLDQIVFSPYWNIPNSIFQNEILPKITADPNYLKKHHMEIVGKNSALPAIRQLPGEDNPLGKVKFLFPNRYDIYFHDTKSKEIFKNDKRAVSHGCIRLADAEKMATYLLRNNNVWTPEKVHAAMNSGREQYVKLTNAVPVYITYITAWVDENNQVNFKDDVYGHDKKLAQMMFSNYPQPVLTTSKDSSLIKK
ncbi:MAG: L,D-transpeptidase family protein, partial [Bacteroidota bacterium]|nr:L,D-transpeptidase family protein [Bacteroidota bacterium]